MILGLLLTTLAHAAGWELVAAYDVAAVSVLEPEEPTFVWRAWDGMNRTCGPAKSPDGLGMFEAEVVGSRLSPVLALILERRTAPGEEVTLDSRDLRVSLGLPGRGQHRRVLLQPMVEPRHLAVRIQNRPGLERYGQLVRTQIEVEACLEHKVGRGWTGHDAERIRQAFLLTPPSTMLPSRKYFGGERDPVPGMLGPPDACVVGSADGGSPALGRGEGSLTLVPTDVWGAELRACETEALTGAVVPPDRTLPLALTGEPEARREHRWQLLDITLDADEPDAREEAVRVRMTLDDTCLFEGPLYRSASAIEDLLARVPHRYPLLRDEGVTRAVLLLPNWQIVEALRQLHAEDPSAEADLPPAGIIDGVGYVLSHPEHLYVQVAPDAGHRSGTCGGEPVAVASVSWPNLAGVMRSQTFGQPWGYTVGLLAGRSPIALPRKQGPSWAQTLAAQRGFEEAVLLLAVFGLGIVALLGLRRLPDLWARVPQERAWYWPGASKAVPTEAELGEATVTPEEL